LSAVTGSIEGLGAYADFMAAPDHRRRIPLSQKVVHGVELHRQLRDPTFTPDPTRLVPRDEELPIADERLTSMGEMIVTADGGSIRTFSGNLSHENGWWPAWKRAKLQHWQGTAQRFGLLRAECEFRVNWAQTEACWLCFPIGNEWFEWCCDLWLDMADGPDELWEIKRDHRQLEDPRYTLKMAGVDEVARRIGKRFRVVMADEIVLNRWHRDNLELFASRRFVTIPPEHLRRFESFAVSRGTETTYGELANAIDPICPARGAAIVQGLTVRRRIEIDLRHRLTNSTPLRIH
jgi:hypothetical protein